MGEKIKCDSSMSLKHYNIWRSDKTRLVKEMKEEPGVQMKELENVSLEPKDERRNEQARGSNSAESLNNLRMGI